MSTNVSDYQAPYYRRWYQENKEVQKRSASSRRKRVVRENKESIKEYLRVHPCIDCGESDIVVLHFDHVRGKKRGNVCAMVQNGCSWKTILKEIAKCEVRCANDHMRKTAREQKSCRLRAAGASGSIAPF